MDHIGTTVHSTHMTASQATLVFVFHLFLKEKEWSTRAMPIAVYCWPDLTFEAVAALFINHCVASAKIYISELSETLLYSFLSIPVEEWNWSEYVFYVGILILLYFSPRVSSTEFNGYKNSTGTAFCKKKFQNKLPELAPLPLSMLRLRGVIQSFWFKVSVCIKKWREADFFPEKTPIFSIASIAGDIESRNTEYAKASPPSE